MKREVALAALGAGVLGIGALCLLALGAGEEELRLSLHAQAANPSSRSVSLAAHVATDDGAAATRRALTPDFVAGIVVDRTGAPLPGVLVSALRGEPKQRTNAAGRFALALGSRRQVLRFHKAGLAGRILPAQPGAFLRVVLGRGGAVRGVCRDGDRNGVPGQVRALAGEWEALVPVGVDGRFTINDLPSGRVELRAEPDVARSSCLPATTQVLIRAGHTAEAELVLPRGQTLRGRVLTRAGRPAAGAQLRVRGVSSAPGSARATKADPQGRFVVRGLTPGEASLIARLGDTSAGPIRVEVPDGEDPERLEVTLAPTPGLRGIVTGVDGRPLPGARCRLAADPLGLAFPGHASATSDAQGRFQFPALPAGEHQLRVRAAGFVAFAGGVQITPAGGPVAVRLDPAVAVRGVVRRADGRPAAGARVTFNDGTLHAARADRAGRFELAGIRPGRVAVRVRAPEAGSLSAERTLLPGPQDVALQLPVAASLTGSVFAAGGAVIAGALVQVSGPADERTITCDDQGRFELSDLGPGPYRVTASAPGHLPSARDDVRAGARLELSLKPGRTYLGVVRGLDGKPVHEAVVGPADAPGQAELCPGGRFSLIVPAGTSALLVRAQGHDPGGNSCSGRAGLLPARVPLPPQDAVLTVQLRAGAEAEGLVVDHLGKPVAGAAIQFGHVREEDLLGPNAAVDLLAMTEVGGSFHLHGIPDAGLLVTLSHPNHAPLVARVSPGRGLKLTLPQAGRLRGVVRGADGAAQAKVPLLIEGPCVRRTTSAADGSFAVGGLAEGRYTVRRLDAKRGTTVVVRAGRATTVDP